MRWPLVACPFDDMSSGRHSCRPHFPHATILYPTTVSSTQSLHPQLEMASGHTFLSPLTTTQMFINVCHLWNTTFLNSPPFSSPLFSSVPMERAPLSLIPGHSSFAPYWYCLSAPICLGGRTSLHFTCERCWTVSFSPCLSPWCSRVPVSKSLPTTSQLWQVLSRFGNTSIYGSPCAHLLLILFSFLIFIPSQRFFMYLHSHTPQVGVRLPLAACPLADIAVDYSFPMPPSPTLQPFPDITSTQSLHPRLGVTSGHTGGDQARAMMIVMKRTMTSSHLWQVWAVKQVCDYVGF